MREQRTGYSLSPKFELYAGGTELEIETILKIISDNEIFRFVEIGVYEGGLTERVLFNTPCLYLGVEINEGIVDHRIKNKISRDFQRLLYGDCMSEVVIDYVRRFSQFGKVLIYCDNGNKKEEIKIYSQLLKSGGILLTHDYWDKRWEIEDYPDYQYREVTPEDVKFLDDNPNFKRLPDFVGTRLVGWTRT